MDIEICLEEENKTLISDANELKKWKEEIADLGLEGQESLYKENKSPIPFPAMRLEERKVYMQVCPKITAVKQFKDETIPLRVLSIIALAEKEEYFTEIEIWSDTEAPDPIVIGKQGDMYYLLARWGKELMSYTEVKKEAIRRLSEKGIAHAKEKIVKLKGIIEDPTSEINLYFQSSWSTELNL